MALQYRPKTAPKMVQEQVKHVTDAAAVGITVGAVVGWLPAVAALFTIVWTAIRIYESVTVQRWIYGPKADSRITKDNV